MNNPLMIAVTLRLVEHGFSVLRFNFRGSGESTGDHDYGDSELLDIDAALSEAAGTDLPVGAAGWSFGGGTALRWLAARELSLPYVGIAPSIDPMPERLPSGPKRIILGTRDQVIDTAPVVEYAVAHSIDVVLTPGDHFFHGRGKRIGTLVAQGFDQPPDRVAGLRL
jgi:alpha/beta superfamily hydrolase